MGIADEKYVALTTFRRNGERKVAPVWIAQVGDQVGFATGVDAWKLRRLRNDSRVELQACNSRGVIVEGSMVATGHGREATAEERDQVRNAIKAKYGISYTVINGFQALGRMVGRGQDSTAVLIDLD